MIYLFTMQSAHSTQRQSPYKQYKSNKCEMAYQLIIAVSLSTLRHRITNMAAFVIVLMECLHVLVLSTLSSFGTNHCRTILNIYSKLYYILKIKELLIQNTS